MHLWRTKYFQKASATLLNDRSMNTMHMLMYANMDDE